MEAFPAVTDWLLGSQVKITLLLDDLEPESCGTIDINVWWKLPSAQGGMPNARVVTSSLLLLPMGSEGAVMELELLMLPSLKNDLGGIAWNVAWNVIYGALICFGLQRPFVWALMQKFCLSWPASGHTLSLSFSC
jgi:hypothetical protein